MNILFYTPHGLKRGVLENITVPGHAAYCLLVPALVMSTG